MSDANFVQCDSPIDYTPATALGAGAIVLLALGLVGVTGSILAAGEQGAVHTEGLFDVNSASATLFSDGEVIYWDNTNKLAVTSGSATASFRLGVAVGAKLNGATSVRVLLNAAPSPAIRSVPVTDSANVTNSSAETIVGTYTIPVGTLTQGRVIEFAAGIIATATNGTDTFQARVRLGGIGGSIIADTTAIDLANNDVGVLMGQIVIRQDGALGKFSAVAQSLLKNTANPTLVQETAIDTTAAITLVLTITESVANAGNVAKATAFNVFVR